MRRLFAGHSFPFLSAVYNYFLFRSVLCLRFFPPLLVPNDCPSVKYASGYFSILLACSPVLYYPIGLCTRFFVFRLSPSRVAVSPGLDTLPSNSPLSSVLAAITTMNRRHYVTRNRLRNSTR